jgi:hypothetical protein
MKLIAITGEIEVATVSGSFVRIVANFDGSMDIYVHPDTSDEYCICDIDAIELAP